MMEATYFYLQHQGNTAKCLLKFARWRLAINCDIVSQNSEVSGSCRSIGVWDTRWLCASSRRNLSMLFGIGLVGRIFSVRLGLCDLRDRMSSASMRFLLTWSCRHFISNLCLFFYRSWPMHSLSGWFPKDQTILSFSSIVFRLRGQILDS